MEPVAAGSDFRLGDWLIEPSLNRVSRGAVVEHVRDSSNSSSSWQGTPARR